MMPAEMLLMIYVAKSEAKYLCQGFLDPDIKDYYCCDALGKPSHTKTDEFSEKFRGGVGYFQSKKLYSKIWTFK